MAANANGVESNGESQTNGAVTSFTLPIAASDKPDEAIGNATQRTVNLVSPATVVSDESSSNATTYRKTSIFSWLLILWTIPVIHKGLKTRLERTMVPKLEASAASEQLLNKAIQEWTAMCAHTPPEKRSLARLTWRLQKRQIVLGAFVGICQGVLFSVARPLLLRQVIIAASNVNSPIEQAIGIVVAFCIVVLLEGICQAVSRQILGAEVSIRFWAWSTGLLEWKATRVDASSVARNGGVEATSLVGHNISRMLEDWRWGCIVFFSATAVIGGVIVLAITLGVSSLPGIAVLAFVFFMNMRLGRVIRTIERNGHEISARRIGLTQDLAANMLGLKLAAWEEPFKKLLTDVRAKDTRNIQNARATTLTSINLGRASPVIASSVSILVLAAVNPDNLTAATIFTALTAFQGLRLPLIGLPSNIIMLQNARVTFEKLLGYLNLPDTVRPEPDENGAAIRATDCSFSWTVREDEIDQTKGLARSKSRKFWKKKDSLGMGASTRFFTTAPGAGKLLSEETNQNGTTINGAVNPTSLNDSSGAIPRVTLSLANVNVEVNFTDKRLVAIVGVVASGKTTLLKSLLGQLPRTQGELRCSHSIGYVPQKPFVLSGTILENIVMGDQVDSYRLDFALKASDFINDIPQFHYGLHTAIGERGQTLSGGQKQRLAICRALYAQPELLVGDDPLSAVDVRVANTIFNGIEEYVRGESEETSSNNNNKRAACLMALNQLHFLPRFDWVLVMDHGVIVEQGRFEDIKGKGVLKRLLEDQPRDATTPELPEETTIESNRTKMLSTTKKSTIVIEENPALDENGIPVKQTSTQNERQLKRGDTISASFMGLRPGGADGNNNSKPEAEQLVIAEKSTHGTSVFKTIGEYLRRMGQIQLPFSLILGCSAYALMSANDILLAFWVQNARTFTYSQNIDRALIYFGISVGHVVVVELLSLWNMRGSVRASKRLHSDVVETLLHAPVSFYESTPSGRIVSRLSGDLSMTDRNLAFVFDDQFHFGFVLLALTVTIGIIVPPLVSFMIVSLFLFAFQLVCVDRTNREAKRFANMALSPILTNLSETVNARAICQLMRYESFFTKRHCIAVDEYSQCSLLSSSVVNLGTMITGVIAFFVSTGAAFLVIFLRAQLDPSLVGLALTYSQIQPYFLGILSTILPIGLSALTSLERILEFCSKAIPSERPWHTSVDEEIKPWPTKGELQFENVELIYRPGLPPSLRGVNFHVDGGEVVGIVGRTGAGKSSILVALLRIHEINSGRVLIDGVDAATVGLQTLRRAVVVIPQEPVLLAGSVMFNLDPFGAFTPEEIVSVAKRVGLEQSSLDKSSAELLSAGERQLVQMTRAILRKKTSQIVVLDEPTSNIDSSTDKALEMIVREEFIGKTRLVIAHRLSTVVHSDKIVVMQRGVVLEFGAPQDLLAKEDGEFRKMMNAYYEANQQASL